MLNHNFKTTAPNTLNTSSVSVSCKSNASRISVSAAIPRLASTTKYGTSAFHGQLFRKVRRSSARILFRMSYFLRKEIRGRIKRKRRVVQKERKWLSRITWSLTTYYGTLFRKRRGPARWLKKQFAALRRVLSGKFHAYESRFESRLDYWLYKLHFTRRLSHSIILLKAGHIRLNGVVEKRFDHILRPLDVITFSPKVSRWYRRCFHGTARQVYSRQLRHPRKKLNVAFYLNSRRFVQQRKTLNTFTRKRLRQEEFLASRISRSRHFRRKRNRAFGQAMRIARAYRQRTLNVRGLPVTYNQLCHSAGWAQRTPRLRRVVGAFRTLSKKIRRALQQRNLHLQSKNKKALLPFYQLQQLNRALRPIRSFRSNLDKLDKRPLDYFLLNELNTVKVCPSTHVMGINKFVANFLTASDVERIQLLHEYFPGISPRTQLTASQLRRIQLLCVSVSRYPTAVSGSELQASVASKTYTLILKAVRQILARASSHSKKYCPRKLPRKKVKKLTAAELKQKKDLRAKQLAALPRTKRIARRDHSYVQRPAMQRRLKKWAYPLKRSHSTEVTKNVLTSSQRARMLSLWKRRYSAGSAHYNPLKSLLSPVTTSRKTLTSQNQLLQVASQALPVTRLVKRLASYKANKTQSDTAVHHLTQAALARQFTTHPYGRKGLRTFIMTFTSRGKILKGQPRSSSADYTQRQVLQLNQRAVRPTITQAARTLAAKVTTNSATTTPSRQDLYSVFSYAQANAVSLGLSRALQTAFFQSRAQQQPCWKPMTHFMNNLKFRSVPNSLSTLPVAHTTHLYNSSPAVSIGTRKRKPRRHFNARAFRRLFLIARKPWDLSDRIKSKKFEPILRGIRRTIPQLSDMLKSFAVKHSLFEVNRRFAAHCWERNLPHYERINNPLRYKTTAYKRHKQRQQLTASFRNRVARWALRRQAAHARLLNTFAPRRPVLSMASARKNLFSASTANKLSLLTAKMARFYPQDFIEWAERRRTRLAVKTEYNPLQYNPEYLLVAYYHHLHGNQMRHRRLARAIATPAHFVSAYLADATAALQTLYARNAHNYAAGNVGSTYYQLDANTVPLTTPLILPKFDTEMSQAFDMAASSVQALRTTRASGHLPESFGLTKTKTRLRSIFQPQSRMQVRAVRWLPTPQARHRFRSTDQWPTPIPYYRWTWQATRIRPKTTFCYYSYFNRSAAGLTKYFRPRRTPTSAVTGSTTFAPVATYVLPRPSLHDYTSALQVNTQIFTVAVHQALHQPAMFHSGSVLESVYSLIATRVSLFNSQPTCGLLPLLSAKVQNTSLAYTNTLAQPFCWTTVRRLRTMETTVSTMYNFSHLKLFAGLLLQLARPANVKQHRRARRVMRRQLSRARRFGYRSRQQMRNSVVSFYYARKHFSFINRMHVLAPRAHVANEVHLPTYAHVVTWRRSENTPTGVRRHGTALTKQRIYAFIRRFKHLM